MVHNGPCKISFYELAMVTKVPYMVPFMDTKFSKERFNFAPMSIYE